jgi:hypothetical protein
VFVVGALDETLILRGMRYHPIDIENSVLRAHKKIAEWWVFFSDYIRMAISCVADPGCLSRIRIFSIPDPGFPSKNLSILTQKMVSVLSELWSGMFIPDPDPYFYPSRIPDPGVKKAPDPQNFLWSDSDISESVKITADFNVLLLKNGPWGRVLEHKTP